MNHPIPGNFPNVMYPGLTEEEQLQMRMSAETQVLQQEENARGFEAIVGPCHHWRPSGLYRTMLKKIVPYTVRGVLWYQGCSDDKHAEIYDTVLNILIQNWRDLWKDELPFLIVQLAPFGRWLDCTGDRFPEVRAAQEWVARTKKNVWLCSSSDAGMEIDIHPKRKRPIGERLALLAIGHVYGADILCEAPMLSYIERKNKLLILHFDNFEGLCIKDLNGDNVYRGLISALKINGEAKEGYIEDNCLYVEIKEDLKNICVDFANEAYYEVNLYNRAGIPAIPFHKSI